MEKNTLTLDRLSDFKGARVRSADDQTVGTVTAAFCDDTAHQPEWIELGTGFLGIKRRVVPAAGARIEGDCIRVPYDDDVVKHEPPFEEVDDALTPESDHALHVYFALSGHRPSPGRLTRYDFMRSSM